MIKQALVAVRRKHRRSLVIGLIMTLVLTLLVSTLAVQHTMEQLRKSIEGGIRAGFSLTSRRTSDIVPSDLARKVSQLKGVKAHNYQVETVATLLGKHLVEATSLGVQLDAQPTEETKLIGAERSDYLSEFTGRLYRLRQGKHITPGSKDVALIHEAFARQNKLRLGDRMVITKGERRVMVTIVGIFDGRNEKPTIMPTDMAENRLITNLETAQQLNGSTALTGATYLVKRPDRLKGVTDQARKLSGVDWGRYNLTDNATSFAGVLENIMRVQRILTIATIAVAVAGLVVMSLVLVFWVRGRLHEIGILLAIGTPRHRIVGQFIIELVVIAVVSSVCATLAGSVISTQLSTGLTSSVDHNQLAGSSGEVVVAPIAYLMAFALGYLVMGLSTVVAMTPIMSQPPKRILSKMN
mgnify:FL=1